MWKSLSEVPFRIKPAQAQVAQLHRPEPGVTGPHQQHAEGQDRPHGDGVRNGHRKASDLAPQGFGEGLGGGKRPQEKRDREVTDQQQQGSVHDPTQGVEEAALLIGVEPLVPLHLQPPDPAIGGIVDPALQAPVKGDLASQPQDVETQGEQGQGAPPRNQTERRWVWR